MKPVISAAQRYAELMNELLLERELHGGRLSDGDETRFIAGLDLCWREMSDAEQEEMERVFAVGGVS